MQHRDSCQGQKVLYEPEKCEEDQAWPSLLACPLGTIQQKVEQIKDWNALPRRTLQSAVYCPCWAHSSPQTQQQRRIIAAGL